MAPKPPINQNIVVNGPHVYFVALLMKVHKAAF